MGRQWALRTGNKPAHSLSTSSRLARFVCAIFLIGTTNICGAVQIAPAGIDETAVFAGEAPIVRDWLLRASAAEAGRGRTINDNLAANLYCRAARYGSLEAVYRLGRMAMAGRGLPRNEAMAATLFSIAAGNGHYGASWMVLLTGVHEDQLPQCLFGPMS